MSLYKRILVPVDGSASANHALVTALQLAREAGARVRVMHHVDELSYMRPSTNPRAVIDAVQADAQRVLAAAMAICESAGVPADSRMVEGMGRRLGEAVADEARDWKADLVAIGTHGRHGLDRVLLGSGAEQVLRLAPVPVLVVRDPVPQP